MTPSVGLRLRALAALFVFTASLGLPLLSFGHFTFDDDRACEPVSLTASHPRAEIQPIRPTLPPEHCALCHWLRAVGGVRTSSVITLHAWLEASAPIAVATPAWRSAPDVTHRSSRAPPSLIG